MGDSFPEWKYISLGQLRKQYITNAVNLKGAFTENEAVIAVEPNINQRFGRYQSYVIFLYGLELAIHEEAYIIHEEDYLVRTSDFEKRVFCLERAPSEAKVALDIIGFILFFVGADDMGAIKANIGG